MAPLIEAHVDGYLIFDDTVLEQRYGGCILNWLADNIVVMNIK